MPSPTLPMHEARAKLRAISDRLSVAKDRTTQIISARLQIRLDRAAQASDRALAEARIRTKTEAARD